MESTNGTSRYNKRPAFIPRPLQISLHTGESHSDVPNNVLTNNPSGPEGTHEAQHFRPDPTVICLASSLPGQTFTLARISAGNNGNCPAISGKAPDGFKFSFSDIFDILPYYSVRPVPPEDQPAVFIDLAEGKGLEARPPGGEGIPSYA